MPLPVFTENWKWRFFSPNRQFEAWGCCVASVGSENPLEFSSGWVWRMGIDPLIPQISVPAEFGICSRSRNGTPRGCLGLTVHVFISESIAISISIQHSVAGIQRVRTCSVEYLTSFFWVADTHVYCKLFRLLLVSKKSTIKAQETNV